MIKLLLGSSPCTHWSIAKKNGRETQPNSGLGWELFLNYKIALEKYKPDYFLYENNKSAAKAIKDQISHELGVDLMYINSSLVSAQNRQRFYAFNWKVDQPEDRGILLKDILVTGTSDRDKSRCVAASVGRTTHREYFMKQQNTMAIEPVDLTGKDKAYALTTTYGSCVPHDTLERNRRSMIVEPVGTALRGRMNDGKWEKQYESREDDKANALTTAQTDSMVAEPVRIGTLPRSDGEVVDHQQSRIYSIEGKSTNINANGGGQGAKTGLYAIPISEKQANASPVMEGIGLTPDNKSYVLSANYANGSGEKIGNSGAHTLEKGCKSMVAEPVNPLISGKSRCVTAGYANKRAKHILESNYSENPHKQTWDCAAEPLGYAIPCEWDEQGRPIKAISRADGKVCAVNEVKDGQITIKGKQYPIKLPDGFYIIRKLTVNECKRLQTIPDWYEFPVSDSQAYKMLGNGWTVEVIKHLLSHIPNILNEEIEVLSMYDGMSCGQIALKEMGCNVVKYYATEIDRYAIQTTQHNFPNTIQLGDAFQVRESGWRLWRGRADAHSMN